MKHISSKVSNGLLMLYLAKKLTDNQETPKNYLPFTSTTIECFLNSDYSSTKRVQKRIPEDILVSLQELVMS